MNEKKVRVLAIVALAFWAVFTVSLILFFTDMNNAIYVVLTLSSGGIGLALYFVVRIMMKEKQYIQTEDGDEPSEPFTEDGEEAVPCNGEEDASCDEQDAEPIQK